MIERPAQNDDGDEYIIAQRTWRLRRLEQRRELAPALADKNNGARQMIDWFLIARRADGRTDGRVGEAPPLADKPVVRSLRLFCSGRKPHTLVRNAAKIFSVHVRNFAPPTSHRDDDEIENSNYLGAPA